MGIASFGDNSLRTDSVGINTVGINTVGLGRAVPKHVRSICEVLRERGHSAWVVGGCVRDHLLNTLYPDQVRSPGDWDIATSARPDQVQKTFPKVIPTGIEHGTVTVLLDKVPYEVTTFRAEANYTDGRRPGDVVFLDDIAADLARRDFTVNAIAYDPLSDVLADPFDGIGDLRRKLIRAVRDPGERFAEDGLRVLRAARFLATLEFSLEENTAQAIRPSLASYKKVSAERVRDEWAKALKARRPSLAFEAMASHGLLAISVPELAQLHATEWWSRMLNEVDAARPQMELRIALLLRGLVNDEVSPSAAIREFNPAMVEAVLTRLRFSNAERTRVARLVQHHAVPLVPTMSPAEIRRWLRNVGLDLVDDVFEMASVRFGAAPFESLREQVNAVVAQKPALSTKELALNGQDLIRGLGISPGPEVGRLLAALLEVVTDEPEANSKDVLLDRARALLLGAL